MIIKKILSFLVLLVVVLAIMLIPKEADTPENETQSETSQTVVAEGDEEQEEEPKEPLGGIKIGTSNMIVLLVLGGILAVNKYKEIKAGQSEERN